MKSLLLFFFCVLYGGVYAQKVVSVDNIQFDAGESLFAYVTDSAGHVADSVLSVSAARELRQLKVNTPAYEILGFTLFLVRKNDATGIAFNEKQGTFKDEVLSFIKMASTGDKLVFDGIRVRKIAKMTIVLRPVVIRVN